MMKLTGDMRLVLDDLIRKEANGFLGYAIDIEDMGLVDYYDKKIALDSVIQELEKAGALEIIREETTVCLTEWGRHYKEIEWLEWKEFLFKSVAAPIVVAFITALITTLLTIGIK